MNNRNTFSGNPLEQFRKSGTLTRLIVINIGVFAFITIFGFFMTLATKDKGSSALVEWLAVPSAFRALLGKPWTIFTYMFLHQDIWHILFNMLWLFWFGSIFRHFFTDRQLRDVYILGGMAGAFLFILVYNVSVRFSEIAGSAIALGASASVMAVVVAVSTLKPDFTINLLLIGPVKIKWIALITIAFDIYSINLGKNAGGHIAHLGGALFGFFYSIQYRKGYDLSAAMNKQFRKLRSLFAPGPRLKTVYRQDKPPVDDIAYNRSKKSEGELVDRILDKIRESGYASLTDKEKEILFRQKDKN